MKFRRELEEPIMQSVLREMSKCNYCDTPLTWIESPTKELKYDGTIKMVPLQENGIIHDCPNAPWKSKRTGWYAWWDQYDKAKLLPVYCNDCRTYYSQNSVCSHLQGIFTPGKDYPGSFHDKYLRQMHKSKKNVEAVSKNYIASLDFYAEIL